MSNCYLSAVELNLEIQDRVTRLLNNPASTVPEDKGLLEQLTRQYPYFKAFHILLAKATQRQQEIEQAVFYSNGSLVRHILEEATTTEQEAATMRTLPTEAASIQDEQEIFEEIGEFDVSGFIQAETDAVDNNPKIQDVQESVTLSAPEIETVIPDEPDHARVSKYDDENLPYTFLWWLAKTRAEHPQIFQPYVAPKQQQQSGPLQQQYIENIFHLQTGLPDQQAPDTLSNSHQQKEEALITAFLRNDPQIKPPPVDKLDNENKARKSAEDHNDLVSETLAAIYIEQMLYHKAIDTYEKLSLKFPEKSRYFADLIRSLEKKI